MTTPAGGGGAVPLGTAAVGVGVGTTAATAPPLSSIIMAMEFCGVGGAGLGISTMEFCGVAGMGRGIGGGASSPPK